MINQIAKTKKNNNSVARLPYGYATKVVEMLSGKGITVKASQVHDIKRGKFKSKNLTVKVLKAIQKVKAQHEKEQCMIKDLRVA